MNRNVDNKIKIEQPKTIYTAGWWLLVTLGLVYAASITDVIKLFDQLRMPIEYKVRDKLNKAPFVDKRLKIIGLDDSFYAQRFNQPYIRNSEWFSILQFISERKPAAIAYDGTMNVGFDFPEFNFNVFDETAEIPIPLHVGVIPEGRSLDLDQMDDFLPERWPMENCQIQSNFNCDFYTNSDGMQNSLKSHYDNSFSDLTVVSKFKKPNMVWHNILKGLGHVSWLDMNSPRVSPVLYEHQRLSPFPYLGLSAFAEWHIANDSLYTNDVEVPVDNNGLMQVNYLSPQALLSRDHARSGTALNRSMKRGSEFDFIQEGDYVLILPYMFTGKTDMIWTAYGSLPGGLVLASVANSALTGQYIKPTSNLTVLVILFTSLAFVFSLYLSTKTSLSLLIATPIVFVLFSLLMFSYFNLSIPWLLPIVGYLCVAIPTTLYRLVLQARSVQSLNIMFEGMVSSDKLKKITSNIQTMEIAPKEKVVTVMFVDIEGFSLLVENMAPRSAFRELKELMQTLVSAVHDHGGVVDKTLGDGILAYFGHDLTGDSYNGNHALDAIKCAIDLQRRNTELVKQNGNLVKFYPLRVGINTSTVFLGNLGNEKRIDYTLVGNGVNFAKRLEGACPSSELLISDSARDFIVGSDIEKQYQIEKITINIKHHTLKVDSYKINPFERDMELYSRLKEISNDRILLNRESIRIKVMDHTKVVVSLNEGTAELKNFSRTGVSLVISGQSIYEGKHVSFNFDSPDASLGVKLIENGIGNLEGIVQWCYEENGKSIAGVRYTDLENSNAQTLFELLTIQIA